MKLSEIQKWQFLLLNLFMPLIQTVAIFGNWDNFPCLHRKKSKVSKVLSRAFSAFFLILYGVEKKMLALESQIYSAYL